MKMVMSIGPEIQCRKGTTLYIAVRVRTGLDKEKFSA